MLTSSALAAAVASLLNVEATLLARLRGARILDVAESQTEDFLSDDAGWNQTKGECATGVQYVCSKAGYPLGRTSEWKEGRRVVVRQGENRILNEGIVPGTPIATFRNGRYAADHAAIFVEMTGTGLRVWDQYNNPPKRWSTRVLSFEGAWWELPSAVVEDPQRLGWHYSNNADFFCVIDI